MGSHSAHSPADSCRRVTSPNSAQGGLSLPLCSARALLIRVLNRLAAQSEGGKSINERMEEANIGAGQANNPGRRDKRELIPAVVMP